MNEKWMMRPGDTFSCEECGCSFTVESGPSDMSMVRQAPQCCCGHQMRKEDGGMASIAADEVHVEEGEARFGAPKATMPG